MANEEQLVTLHQGVDVWNKWRGDNPGIAIDLRDADLKGLDLRRTNFREANLRGAHLDNTNLSHSDLYNALLLGSNLEGADLHQIDLRQARIEDVNFAGADLHEAQLWHAIIFDSIFNRANLTETDFKLVKLVSTNFMEADLSNANFREAQVLHCDLSKTTMQKANLIGAILYMSNLSDSNLLGAELVDSTISNTKLRKANFLSARMYRTLIGNSDLSDVIGLESVIHFGPSSIGADTIANSRGRIPAAFLRGCGLSDWEIKATELYVPELSNHEVDEALYELHELRAGQAIQVSPLFISYSHADSAFVEILETHLNKKGIRFWRDVHGLKSGRIENQIDRAIRQNPNVLLVLSEHSLTSDWVEHEVRTARSIEKELKHDVLCPVALDDSWKNSPWPKRVMEQIMEYNILDFSDWRDARKFEGTFNKLIDGLELFYK